MIGGGMDITGFPVTLHSHIQKSILSTSNEITFQWAINRTNDADWQIWQEKQQRVYIIGKMFFRALNIFCSCILFSHIVTSNQKAPMEKQHWAAFPPVLYEILLYPSVYCWRLSRPLQSYLPKDNKDPYEVRHYLQSLWWRKKSCTNIISK